jgi:hypothetical protein
MRSLRLPIATAVVGVLAAVVLAAANPDLARGLSNCSASQLVPALGDVTVNQGLGNYAYRVRGKETLVKFFLTNPTTCTVTNTQSITITGATLAASTAPSGSSPLVAFQSFSASPAVTTSVSTNSPADPVFAVPSTWLTPSSTGTFTPTFTATVTYSRKSGTSTTTGLTATFSNSSAIFDKQTRALRVLVVPMGDASPGVLASTQFTSTDQTSTQNGFSALSRIFPVPAGVSGLNGTGGIRYTMNLSSMVNLRAVTGAYDINGNFCGSGGNFDAIKAQLAQFMQSWNSNPLNVNLQVDRVLGVVGQSISDGADTSNVLCADGMASVVSPEAWVRAISDKASTKTTPAVPSRTGSLMAMELSHTWGGEPNCPTPCTHHSSNLTAETTNPGRAYNVATRSYLATNRTVMRYTFVTSPPWDDTLTLLEPADYSYDRCAFGGTTTTDCSALGTTTGTTLGVAAGNSYVVSGTVDTTTNTADIVQSGFFSSLQLGTDDNSLYRYVHRNANTGSILKNIGFHVSFENTLHNPNAPDDQSTGKGLFSFALPDDTPLSGSDEVQLWKVASLAHTNPTVAGGDVLLYDVKQQASPPQVLSTTTGVAQEPSNFTNTSDTSELHPALTDDRSWIAWDQALASGEGIEIAPTTTNGFSQRVEVPTPAPGAEDPAWNSQGTALAYELNGDLYTQGVDLSGTNPTFGTPTKIYDSHDVENPLPAAHHPTWSRDGSAIAFDAAAGSNLAIWTIPAAGGAATQLTSDTNSHDPSWSHTADDNRIAYTRGPDNCTPDTKLYVIAPDGTGQKKVSDQNCGLSPSFGTNGRIAFVSADSNIWTIKPDGTEANEITTGGQDTFPSAAGDSFAFDRVFSSQDDIMLTSPTGKQSVTFTASSTAPLKGEVDYECNGVAYPVAVGLTSTEREGVFQTFNTNFDGSLACAGGVLRALVTDGIQHAAGDPTPTAIAVAPKDPTAAIFTPLDTTYSTGATFPVSGTGFDAEGLMLPASSLHWTLKLPDGTVQDLGSFASKDIRAPPPAGWPTGTLTFTLTARDASGATTTATRNVQVRVLFNLVGGGFLPPIVNPSLVNSAKPGTQYPIKWQLTDASGRYISDLKTVAGVEYRSDGNPPTCDFATSNGPFMPLPTGGTVLRYDSNNNQFVYNWTTPSTPGCYVFQVSLTDGTDHQAWFQLSR